MKPAHCLFLIAALALAGPSWAQSPAASVTASPDLQRRLGMKTATLKAERRKSQVDAFAKVLDPEPLVQLQSDLATAIAAAAASSAEAARSKALHAGGGSVSAKDTEAAEAQAKSDAIHVAFLRQRLWLEWGPGVARLSEPARAKIVEALVAGKAAIVHVDTPSNAGQAGARTVKVDIGDDSVPGVVLGPARQSEPRLQSSGLIVEVTGPSAILLSTGLTNSAHIDSGSPQSGIGLPRSAVVRYRGSVWAYVAKGGDRFERRLVQDPVPEEGGLFVAQGFSPGESVVVSGVGGLFAAELAQSSVGAR